MFIYSFQATAGYLERCHVEFAKGMTCIIGARGTCKSTLIESMRFAFDADKDRVRTLLGGDVRSSDSSRSVDSSRGMISSTLGVGSVRLSLMDDAELPEEITKLVLEREVGTEPRVFLDGVREHTPRTALLKIEVFSQGDLQRIAEDPGENLRLRLIDRPHAERVKYLLSARLISASNLRDVGEELRKTRARIVSLKQELVPAPQLAQALERAIAESPTLAPEFEAERQSFDGRARAIEALEEAIQGVRLAAQYFEGAPNFAEEIDAALAKAIAQSRPEVGRIVDSLRERSAVVRSIFAQCVTLQTTDIEGQMSVIREVFDDQNEPFFRMRQEQQNVNEALKKQEHLRRQVEHMEKLARELVMAHETVASHLAKRSEVRIAISRIDDEIFDLRTNEIRAINGEHGETIFLTLQTDGSSNSYASRLTGLLKNSRIRSQDEVAAQLANSFPPATLIDLVESGNGQKFAESLGRDIGQMNRVVAYLGDHPDLYQLEAEAPAARLDITMYDNGQAKPIETLSKGQKATAMLPLILRVLPYPLLLDQPEDDLDNSFVISSLVNAIRTLKLKRQLIVVTHNANIPVLGDADRIVVMGMKDPLHADTPKSGTVDECRQEILNLLEGGARAFVERETRYGDLLKNPGPDVE